jgi:FdrA protein
MGDDFYMVGKPHPMIDAIEVSKRTYKRHGGNLTVIASICGTNDDPQDLRLQTKMLQDAGVLVFDTDAGAIEA